MGKKLSEQDYVNLANSRGFEWIGIFLPNTKTQTMWKCGKGHVWRAVYANISRGSGCPKCSRKARILTSDYREVADRRGFVWLGTFPKSTRIKTRWQCQNGHVWGAMYNSIRRGSGCPECDRAKRMGKNNRNFRGGNLAFHKKYGDDFNEKKKKEIRMRDNYTCMMTGEYLGDKRRKADVHHIIPARVAPSNWKNSTHNLITLSHKMNAWADSNPEESIPLLRKALYDKYGYDFSGMDDYDLSLLKASTK